MSKERRDRGPLEPVPSLESGEPSQEHSPGAGAGIGSSSFRAKSPKCAAADQVEGAAVDTRDVEVCDLAGSHLFSALLELDVRVSLRPVEGPRPAGSAAPEWTYTITDPDGGALLTDVTRAALEEWTRRALEQHADATSSGQSLDRLYAAFEIREAVGLLQDLFVALLAAQRAAPDDRARLTGLPLEEWIRRALDQQAAARCESVAPARCESVALTLGELAAQIRELETKHGRGILASELVATAGGQTGHVLGIRAFPVGGSIVVELETDIGAVPREAAP